MASLDQMESLRQMDAGGMMGILQEFPDRVERAFAQPLPAFAFSHDRIRSIALVGLGGSAIGGDLVAAGCADILTKPFEVLRSAILPAWIGRDTMVIAASYSGNTAEVLAAYEEALRRGCMVAAVTSGGTLAASASRDGVPLITLASYPQPRLAVGDLTAAVMKAALYACGIAWGGQGEEIIRMLARARPQLMPSLPTEDNPAKLLAYKLLDRIPIVAGGGVCLPVARRWKTQVNENAKTICIAESIPELFHNTIEGAHTPLRFADDSVWVLLDAPHDRAVSSGQLDSLETLLQEHSIRVERVRADDEGGLAAQWRLLYFGDWVSFYLAILNGTDPMPVPVIQAFKKKK